MPLRLVRRAFFLLLLCAFPARAQEALLLGYRVYEPARRALPGTVGRDSSHQAAYRTLLVYPDAGGQYRGQSGPGLVVATNRGLVRVGVRRSFYNAWGEDFVWSARPGAVPDYAGIAAFSGEYCTGYRSSRVVFAGGRYVGVETQTAGYCDGTASPWNFTTLAVLPLDSLQTDGVDIGAALGVPGTAALARGAEAFLERLPAARRDRLIPDADPANWTLARRQGRWVVMGRLEPIELVDGGPGADFEIPLAAPPILTGLQGVVNWASVRAAVRDAQDAFASPGGTLVAIQRPNLVTIHPVVKGRIGQAVVGHPLPDGVAIVSAHWIDARAVPAAQRAVRNGEPR